MSAFEKINGITRIDPQSLIELSLSFAKEEKMTNRAAAKHICRELWSFMKETDTAIISRDLGVGQPNYISFAEKNE
jgi:hypothetical protein